MWLAPIPPIPVVDPVSAPVSLRYEDVAQDGRITLLGLPHAIGDVTLPLMMAHPDTPQMLKQGILPILVRLVLAGTAVGIPAAGPLRGQGIVHPWTVRSSDGSVDRIVLSMWLDLHGRPGTTLGGPDRSAPEALVGRIYAEQVLTRPFAPPDRRRVVSTPSGVPEASGVPRPFAEVGGGGEALPSVPIGFGMAHTDSNQHINSLVYLRRFEDAAVDLDPSRPLARRCEIAWRKPFFAGDRATLRRWAPEEGGIAGAFVDSEGIERCRIAMR